MALPLGALLITLLEKPLVTKALNITLGKMALLLALGYASQTDGIKIALAHVNAPIYAIDTLGWLGSWPYVGGPFELARTLFVNHIFVT